MIDVALTYIRDILNENFKNEFSISENKVVLSNIIKSDGSSAQNVDEKIVFFLISLDEESTLKNSINRSSNPVNNSFTQKSATLHLNMQLMFCANFDSSMYVEGLSYLSALIRFFQINKRIVFDDTSNSGHHANRLSFELCKLDSTTLSHLWSAIGSKLMPSIVYKVGMLVFDDLPVGGLIPAIRTTNNQS